MIFGHFHVFFISSHQIWWSVMILIQTHENGRDPKSWIHKKEMKIHQHLSKYNKIRKTTGRELKNRPKIVCKIHQDSSKIIRFHQKSSIIGQFSAHQRYFSHFTCGISKIVKNMNQWSFISPKKGYSVPIFHQIQHTRLDFLSLPFIQKCILWSRCHLDFHILS